MGVRFLRLAAVWLAASVGAGAAAGTAGVPVAGGADALAVVNGEPVTLGELRLQIAAFHASLGIRAEGGAGRPDAAGVLDRMIRAKLIALEAENMGLDEQPEVVAAVGAFEREQRRRLLYDLEVAGIERGDPEVADRLYRRTAGRYRVSSVLFEDAAEAGKLVSAVRAGEDYDALARQAVAAGRARPGDEGVWMGGGDLRPEVEAVVAGLAPGQTAGPLPLAGGAAVIRLLEAGLPDDPAARRRAEEEALRERKVEALRRFGESLRRRYCRIDREVLDGIDYDAPEPGFAAYSKDARIVARVDGGEAVTVAALTEALQRKFYHGADSPNPRRRYAEVKEEVLGDMLLRRTADLEARRRGLDRSPAFLSSVRGFREELLFGAFVRRVIDPEIRVEEAAVRRHYEENRADFEAPGQLRLRALSFGARADADAAIARLREGAAFEWLRGNARGQVAPTEGARALELPAGPVSVTDLPEGLRSVLAGAKARDERLYEDPDGSWHVIQVREVRPPEPVPFETVRARIAARLEDEARRKAVEEWAARLREIYEVEVLVDPAGLDRMLLGGAAGAP